MLEYLCQELELLFPTELRKRYKYYKNTRNLTLIEVISH